MMKAILGSALGGVVAGAVALVASAQGRSAPEAAWSNGAQTNVPYGMTVADARTSNSAATTASPFVQCEPYQQAVLQRSLVAGREVAQVACVTREAPPATYASSQAAYQDGRLLYGEPDIVQAPIVQTAPRARRVTYVQREAAAPKRSWKKTALIIGGSTGAGAGVGAIAGGKKGALIGAAIGGGAASIYEAVKRK